MASPSLPSLRVRGWTTVVLMGLAVFGFVLSAAGERSFQGGPEDHRDLVTLVVDDEVTFRSAESEEWGSLESGFEFQSGLSFRTGPDSHLGIVLGEADLIRLFPDTEILIKSADLEASPMQVTVVLNSGAVWLSDLQGVADLTLETAASRVEPEVASVHVSHASGTTEVFAAHHPVRFSFLNSETGELWNNYLLTESHRLTVNEAVVTPVVEELRYTKLVKEFPFSYVEESLWDSEWTIALRDDQDRLRQTYQDFISALRREGNGGYESGSVLDRLSSAWRSLQRVLVFSQNRWQALEEDEGFRLIEEALYLILEKNQIEALDRLERFNALGADFEDLERLEPLYPVFQSVNVTHAFYPVKELLRALRLAATSEDQRLVVELHFLRERLNEVYDLLDEGDLSDAKQALLDYAQSWESLTETYGLALGDHVQTLTEERQILQNLLYRESIFYDVEAYAVMSVLEDRILTLTAEEYELNEERQAFVKDKIASLNQLIGAIDAGKVGLKEGTELAQTLIDEAQTLIQGVTVQVAVVSDFFVPELSELSLMVQFLNSPDYLLGEGVLEEKFEAYLDKQEDLRALSDYLAGLQSAAEEGESSVTLDEAMAAVDVDFEEIGLTYLALLPLGDTDYRLFSIEGGRIGGIDFEANYDRGTGIVYSIKVEGNTFSSGVKLENLAEALQQAVEEAPEEETSTTAETSTAEEELSPVESVAITLVLRTLESETGLDMEEAVVSILDFEQNLFAVEFEMTSGGVTATVSFSYEAEENALFDVTAETDTRIVEVEVETPEKLEEAVLEVLTAETGS